jgi:transcriptional regulator with XRE-family HTH domain
MIHKLIKRGREESGLTQAMVATLADVPRSQLQILEKGGNVTRETLEKVLSAIGMSLAVISRDDIARMREALEELDAVLGKLASQVTAPPTPDPRRILEMSTELVETTKEDGSW